MPFDSHQFEHDRSPASMAKADAASLPAKLELSELERSLPDDLQVLAEQLGEDAFHLSALYPPHASQQWQAASLQAASLQAVALQAAAELLDAQRSGIDVLQARKLSLRWMKPALVAASLLLAVTLAWQAVPKQTAPESIPVVSTQAELKPASLPTKLDATQPQATKLQAADNLLTYHPVVDQPAASNRVIGTVEREQAMVPAGLFLTLSGPEQEAMLDLIEDAKLQQPSVSF